MYYGGQKMDTFLQLSCEKQKTVGLSIALMSWTS